MKIFGERLKLLRTDAGLSILKLSKKIGVSDAAICRWENDKANASCEDVANLAKFFGVSSDYLLGLED